MIVSEKDFEEAPVGTFMFVMHRALPLCYVKRDVNEWREYKALSNGEGFPKTDIRMTRFWAHNPTVVLA